MMRRLTPDQVVDAYLSLGLSCIVNFTFYRSRHGDGRVTDASPVGAVFLFRFPEERQRPSPSAAMAIDLFDKWYTRSYREAMMAGFSLSDTIKIDQTIYNNTPVQRAGYLDGGIIRYAVEFAGISVCQVSGDRVIADVRDKDSEDLLCRIPLEQELPGPSEASPDSP